MNCQDISNHLQTIKVKRKQLDSLINDKKIVEAVSIKNELTDHLQPLFDEYPRPFRIEDNEFPVFGLQIGGKTKGELLAELETAGIDISEMAREMINSQDFTTLEKPENIHLVRLTASELGFSEGATSLEIFLKAQESGLELCPAEVAPRLLLNEKNRKEVEYTLGMKEIDGRLFRIKDNNLGMMTRKGRMWLSQDEFVFCVPNKEVEK